MTGSTARGIVGSVDDRQKTDTIMKTCVAIATKLVKRGHPDFDDIVQEMVVQALMVYDKVDAEKGSLGTYAGNRLFQAGVRYLKRKNRQIPEGASCEVENVPGCSLPADSPLRLDGQPAAWKALSEMSVKQIADRFGFSEREARAQRRKVKEAIESKEEGDA